jgi:hypothetical protein
MRFDTVVHVDAPFKLDVQKSVVIPFSPFEPVLVLAILEPALNIAINTLHVAHQPYSCIIGPSEILVQL